MKSIKQSSIDHGYSCGRNNVIGKNESVVRIICCCNGAFDMLSHNFKKKLCELNPSNEMAQMLLHGENFIIKLIEDTFRNANNPFD